MFVNSLTSFLSKKEMKKIQKFLFFLPSAKSIRALELSQQMKQNFLESLSSFYKKTIIKKVKLFESNLKKLTCFYDRFSFKKIRVLNDFSLPRLLPKGETCIMQPILIQINVKAVGLNYWTQCLESNYFIHIFFFFFLTILKFTFSFN